MSREYDVVVFGATGYTGKLVAKYITNHLPTDLKWAIAGRSETKLQAIAKECLVLNPDRVQPEIELCNLSHPELSDLARKATILIATVGPYALYGEAAFAACAENGTHYLDVTGETPWVANMIAKYEKTSKATGAIMISQIGLESTPCDLIAWSLVGLVRRELSTTTREVICSLHEIKSVPSGGTLASVLNLSSSFKPSEIFSKPYSLSPIPGPTAPSSATWLSKLLGYRRVPILGQLATHLGSVADVPIVERSWGLLGGAKTYGPNFRFMEYMGTKSFLKAVTLNAVLTIGGILLSFGWFRWLMRKVVYKPGEGPKEEDTRKDRCEYRAIAIPERNSHDWGYCRATYEGGIYHLTALFLCEAAMVLLKDNDVPAKKLGGGVMTPATLGAPFIERLDSAGFKIETRMEKVGLSKLRFIDGIDK